MRDTHRAVGFLVPDPFSWNDKALGWNGLKLYTTEENIFKVRLHRFEGLAGAVSTKHMHYGTPADQSS